ncbi:hypothetical protein NliqN6_2498 [Naganishia liquefaciens]|uniref:Uncharacterized protein n=1 Tax=Naganishia liquefaciens TaxID=104408 RepID=A0A8H3YFV1_9TREE|nr:hypothetical protein NliqN6_2498 [Naganishia liquefaciens]
MSAAAVSSTSEAQAPPTIISRDFLSSHRQDGLPGTPQSRAPERDITSGAITMLTPAVEYQFPRMSGSAARQAAMITTPARVPQFAEEFTPQALKAHKHRTNRVKDQPIPIPVVGSSKAGWFDAVEGDLFRGASTHPGTLDGFSKHPGKAGDTASVKTTSSSSSSISGLELGRRVTQAIDKVGDALHLRRGSDSSTNTKTDTLTTITTRDSSSSTSIGDSDSSSSSSSSDDGATTSGIFRRRRHRRRSVRSRTGSRRSQSPDAISTGTLRRRQIPTRREFTLMLPRPIGEDDISETTLAETQPTTARVRIALPPSAQESVYTGTAGLSPLDQPAHDWHGRLITTPALKAVIDRIREERQKSGYEAAFQAETEKREARERRKRKRRSHQHHSSRVTDDDLAASRPDSGEGRRRGQSAEDKPDRKRTSRNRLEQLRTTREFHKVTFDDVPESLSRQNASEIALTELRTRSGYSEPEVLAGDIIRPKSASDLLGLKNALSSSTTSIKSIGQAMPARPLPKRSHPFKLPPRPVFNRAHTVIGPASVFAKPAAISEDALEIKKGCWWLDVSCPTWEDLRDLGELLHLHPLTLEDVLQQDPREKIDVFENLGYHFIVFRAIDETYFKYTAPEINGKSGYTRGRSGRGRLEIVENRPGKEGLEGLGVGGLNVYIVVFADGVVSFHNDDISKHTERVREKILTLQRDTASPEWIAHGLLDSIVDAFFPLISHIDDEVDEIDTLVIDPSNTPKKEKSKPEHLPIEALSISSCKTEVIELQEKGDVTRAFPKPKPKKKKRRPLSKRLRRGWKQLRKSMTKRHRHFQLWFNRSHIGRSTNAVILYLRRTFGSRHSNRLDASPAFQPIYDRTSLLHRMTEMRRLVTGLTRLLGAKYQVVSRLRKRAALGGGEVGVYISDVQDHIIMLQTSLLHYEYILSHCQPAYMAHLSVTFAITRSGTSDLILALSVVGIGILPLQLLTSLCGTNVTVPHNGDDNFLNADGTVAGYSAFGIVLAISVLIIIGYGWLVKFWKKQAREKGRAVQADQVQHNSGFGVTAALRRQWERTAIRFRKGV